MATATATAAPQEAAREGAACGLRRGRTLLRAAVAVAAVAAAADGGPQVVAEVDPKVGEGHLRVSKTWVRKCGVPGCMHEGGPRTLMAEGRSVSLRRHKHAHRAARGKRRASRGLRGAARRRAAPLAAAPVRPDGQLTLTEDSSCVVSAPDAESQPVPTTGLLNRTLDTKPPPGASV